MRPANKSTALTLELGEAGELATAWMAKLADEHGIRILVIKGPTLAHHGLRPPRISADVDVLVDPPRFDEFRASIVVAGWRDRPQTEVGAVWAGHSLTYFHDEWPCDIDAHRYFPGFLADPAAVFEQLWASHEEMSFGHQTVPIPSRNASLLIASLHQLRDGRARSNLEEVAGIARVELTDSQRRDLVELARCTGSLAPLRNLFPTIGVPRTDLPAHVESAELRAWQARVDADASGAYFWMLLLERTPPRDRLGVLSRALWPPRSALLTNNPATRDTVAGRTLARLARFPKGLRGLPRAVRAMRTRN